jgi:hypothetical protein
MSIKYDENFEYVISELQANFGWGNVAMLPDDFIDLLNDTIKATKRIKTMNVINKQANDN